MTRGLKGEAQVIMLDCKCGGSLTDDHRGSYTLDSSTQSATCDQCGETYSHRDFPNRVPVFAPPQR